MPIAKLKCPVCKGPAQTVSSSEIAGIISKTYICGHVDVVKKLSAGDFSSFVSLDNKHPYPFQVEGALFAAGSANGRVLIMDEMGLGKTVQSEMVIWAHPKEMLKALVLCRAGLKVQWQRETTRWNGEDWAAQIIEKESDFLVPGMRVFVLSFDTLWRFKDIAAWIKAAKIKTIVIDEVQHIKNSDSKRTNGVRLAAREVPYIIGLSGTPIKNNVGEFFPILNILRPDLFPTKNLFDQIHADTYWSGKVLKYGGLRDTNRFKQITKDFIIRRTREEVLPDLPAVSRDFRFSELGGAVEEAYKNELKQFQDYYNYGSIGQTAQMKQSNILAYLTKMRHITGIAKIEPCLDWVSDFMTETDRKLVIFAHHKDVRKILWEKLEELRLQDTRTWGSGILSLPEDPNSRPAVIQAFEMPQYRIMIASSLASSEGLNLQFCSDCITVEHQWTSVADDQAEGRFIRIGQKSSKVFSTYLIAVGTVDEFLVKIKERKRAIVANVTDGKVYDFSEASILKELAEVLAMSGGQHWGW